MFRLFRITLFSIVCCTSLSSSHKEDVRNCDDKIGVGVLNCEVEYQQSEDKWWLEGMEISINRKRLLPQSSTFILGVKDSVPSPQIWSRCEHCAMEIDEQDVLKVVLFDPSNHIKQSTVSSMSSSSSTSSEDFVISSNKWRGFFHDQPEMIYGEFEEEGVSFVNSVKSPNMNQETKHRMCHNFITRPVFIFSILTWQVGHLIVDVLEPLYYTMMSQYGRIPIELKPILIFEVASQKEGSVFLEKLISTIHDLDTPYNMLKYFTKNGTAFHTTSALRSLVKSVVGRVCFADLHVGLDLSHSYYALGFDRHPQGFAVRDDRQAMELSYRYCQFRDWLWGRLGWDSQPLSNTSNVSNVTSSVNKKQRSVTLISRQTTRRLLNEQQVLDSLTHSLNSDDIGGTLTVNHVALEKLSFSEQGRMFLDTSILVAQYGSALHNTLFLRPGSTVVIMMQPEWCDWAWGFASQASLLKHHVYIMCDEADERGALSRYRWYENSWLQGPWFSKDDDYRVSIPTLQQVMHDILKSYKEVHDETTTNEAPLVHRSYYTSTASSRQCDQKFYLSFHNDMSSVSEHASEHGGEEEEVGFDEGDDVFKYYADNYKGVSKVDIRPPRAHIANISVTETVQGHYLIKMVPEVVIDSRDVGYMRRNHNKLLLCSEVLDPSSTSAVTSPSCHDMRTFNEFSTLDLTFSQHNLVVVHVWLEISEKTEEECSIDTPREGVGACMSTLKLEQSDTYFAVDSENPFTMSSDEFTCGSSDLSIDIVIDDFVHKLIIRLWEPTNVQTSVSDFCYRLKLSKYMCSSITAAVVSRVKPHARLTQFGLPPPQVRPSIQEPFIFLHHEKTAGTSLRRYIVNSALEAKVKFHVPCFMPDKGTGPHIDLPSSHIASCMSFNLEKHSVYDKSQLSVIAGHFEWGVWNDRTTLFPFSVSTPRIFIMFRDPIKRAVSLYYERLFPIIDKMINELSLVDLEYYLFQFKGSAYSVWRDEGFMNSTCRMMCGLNIHKGKNHVTPELEQEALTGISFDLASKRLNRCVVGLTEEWEDSKLVIDFWYPWIDVSSETFRENYAIKRGIETRQTLKPSHLALMDSVNSCDAHLYEEAKKIFQKQLTVIRA